MEIFEIKEVPERRTVAPPMVVAVAVKKGDKSTFAVKWALDHLMSAGQTLILLHVRPRLLTIPTPMGNHVPISQVQGDVVAAYMQEVNSQTNALFSPYRRLCNANKVKTVFAVVEEDDVASAIIKQISSYGIGILVVGSSSSNALVRRFKGFDIPATVTKNAPNFCTVYTISKNKSISVRKATCTESKIGNPEASSHHSNGISDTNSFSFPRTGSSRPTNKSISVRKATCTESKIGNPEDSSHHSNGCSDTNSFSFPRTGGTESETETSNQYYSQPLPFRRCPSPSNINQVMRSRSDLNSATSISNVENLKSGSISVSQTSTVAAVHGSGTGRSSISRSEGYNECNSTLSIDEREYPNNSTEVPWTSAPSPGDLPSMESDTYYTFTSQFSVDTPYYTFTSQFSVDTPPVDHLSGTLQAEPPIFSDSLRGGHQNVNIYNENGIPEMEISSFKIASTSNNEPLSHDQWNIMIERENLKLELQQTLGMFAVEREEAMKAKVTVNELTQKMIEDARKVEEAKTREERARTIAAQEKAKSQMAMRLAETARRFAEREAQQRRDAEIRATTESEERKKAQKTLESTHQGYRRYSIEEIQTATEFFSDSLKIGEGAYGSVYMCTLQHTTVAVKVLKNEATQGIQEFQREIEILGRVRHPHIVLLLGACLEHGCLVYEYMANGSLEDRLLCKGNSAPLPWFSRFRIILEVASALLFLHSAQREPIVHCNLKPANILLDHNFVTKIGDAGIARIAPAKTTTTATQYNNTVPAGTFCYIDPEYQRTGNLGPKSDLYAMGIIILQLLTGKPPMAVTDAVKTAIENGSFQQILDKNAGDWPLKESLELATLGLKCAEFRRRDRPDLEKDVLPEFERFKALAVAQTRQVKGEIDVMPPNHFICPILQEVMDDPHVAADGFTYEHSIIKAWLENNNTSPMTNLPLIHKYLLPNHSLRSAILDWKVKFGFNKSDL